MQKGFIIILILALIVGIFAISNSGVVTIDFIFTKVLLSQAIVIFICVLLGALIASIFGGIRQMSLSKQIKELSTENQALDTSIQELDTKNQTLEKEKEELAVQLAEKQKELYLSRSNNATKIVNKPTIND